MDLESRSGDINYGDTDASSASDTGFAKNSDVTCPEKSTDEYLKLLLEVLEQFVFVKCGKP